MKLTTDIKSHILTNYNQVQLFKKYLNIDINDIYYCLSNKNNKICNPLRVDKVPSLSFMYTKYGKLIIKDWASNIYNGDIFNLLAIIYNLNSNNSHDFIKICNIIINDNKLSTSLNNELVYKNNNSTSLIEFKDREFNKFDYNYFNNGGISLNHLLFRKVYAVEYLWVNNMRNPVFVHVDNTNPKYIYYLGKVNDKNIIKSYSPFESKNNKFISNSTGIFEAIHELYKAETLIITKSRKDKLVIECNLYDYNNELLSDKLSNDLELNKSYKYCITNLVSENHIIDNELYNILSNVYNNIILNVDYDKTGLMNGFYHKEVYDFDMLYLGNTNISINDFTPIEINKIIEKIHNANKNAILFKALFTKFINDNSGGYSSKDMFEYFTNNSIKKGRDMLNKTIKNYV